MCAELELSLSTSEFMQTFSQQNTTAVYLPEQVRLHISLETDQRPPFNPRLLGKNVYFLLSW